MADPSGTRVLYPGTVVPDILRDLWAEPASPGPPSRSRWDWILVAVLMVGGLAEGLGLFDYEVGWPAVNITVVMSVPLALPWRRTHPLRTATLVFSA